MAYSTISKGSDHFNTVTYTGNSSTNAITTGHSSGWVWIKRRDGTYEHNLFDQVRGVTKEINTNSTAAESTVSGSLTSFDSNGFTLGSDGQSNTNSDTFVAWSWKAGGTGSSNGDGSITSTVSANTTSGFSVIKYTGTGSNASIGHGLGAIPHMAIFKRTDTSGFDWFVYHKILGAGKFLNLDLTSASQSSTSIFQNTTPTASLITLGGDGGVNASGGTYICYAFSEKKGYSRFSDYTGNGSTDGPFVYTGFKPAFVLSKNTSATQGWFLIDNKRANPYNPVDGSLHPNSTGAEDTSSDFFVDFYSNGFKIRDTDAQLNASGNIYIYMAFAEAPLVGSNNVPATAR